MAVAASRRSADPAMDDETMAHVEACRSSVKVHPRPGRRESSALVFDVEEDVVGLGPGAQDDLAAWVRKLECILQ